MILAQPMIFILYGNEYAASIGVLQVLVWYTLFSYVGAVRNIWVIAENKQKYLWVINVIGAIMNVIMNYTLIPQYGAFGAAIASLMTQFTTNVIMCIILKPYRYSS